MAITRSEWNEHRKAVTALPRVTLVAEDKTLPTLRLKIESLEVLVRMGKLPSVDYMEPAIILAAGVNSGVTTPGPTTPSAGFLIGPMTAARNPPGVCDCRTERRTGRKLMYRSSWNRSPSKISLACTLDATRESPSAPSRIAS